MVSVVVWHSQQAVLDAVTECLSSEADLYPVTATVNLGDIEEIVSSTHPDVLVLAESVTSATSATSAASPGSDTGIVEVIRGIRRSGQRPAILVVASAVSAGIAVDAVAAGADGWVAEEAPVDELLAAIRGISAGRVWLSRTHLQEFLDRRTATDDSAGRLRSRFQRLTSRETAALGLLLEGKDSAAIARQLGIRTSTARVHIGHVLSKLEVHTALEAVALARRCGITPLTTSGAQQGHEAPCDSSEQ